MGGGDTMAIGNHQHTVGRYLLSNVIVVFLGLLTNQVIQTVGAAVLTRIIANPARYGEVNVLLQILGLVGIFLSLGLNSALTYVLATKRANHEHAYWLALMMGVGFGTLLAALLSIFAGVLAHLYHLPPLAPALFMMSLVLILNSVTNVVMAVLSGHKLFRLQSVALIIPVLSTTTGMVVAVAAGLSRHVLLEAAIGQVAGTVVGLAAVTLLARRHLPSRRGASDWTMLRPLLRYGIPMWAGNIAKSFQQPFLVIIMGLVSLSAAGYLSNALKIGGFLNNITWAFNIVVLPWLSEVQGRRDLVRTRATMAFRYNNYLIYPLATLVILERHPIAVAVFGARFAHTGAYVLPIAAAIGCSSFSRLGGTLLAGIGQPRGNFWPMAAAGLITLVGVPIMLGHANPLLAVYPYLLGWVAATALTIVFAIKDGLYLDFLDAFGRPALPSLFMLGLYTLFYLSHLSAYVTLGASLLMLVVATWAVERRRLPHWRRPQSTTDPHQSSM
jgi:O-antigen/teichoic acid export membrane protein